MLFLQLQGQNSIVIDSLFVEKDLESAISYIISNDSTENINTIKDKRFKPFESNFIGVKNKKLWFRFTLNNKLSNPKKIVLKIKANTISNFVLYKKGIEIEKIFTTGNICSKRIKVPLELEKNTETTFYIEAKFMRSVFFPAKIMTLERSKSQANRLLVEDSIFYGFAIVVLIINLFFLINTKDSFYLYYCLFLLAIVFSIMNAQGIVSCLLNISNGDSKINIVLFLNFFTMLMYMLFTEKSLDLNKRYPKHRWIGGGLLFLFVVLSLIYKITNNITWYSILKLVYFITTIVYWFYGILLFNKLVYARFLTFAYTLLLVLQIVYMLSLNFGLTQIGFDERYYKIGCFVDIIVFLYAISYRYKELEKTKDYLEVSYNKSIEGLKELEEKLVFERKKVEEAFEEKLKTFKEKYELSEKEVEVFKRSLQGLKNKEIAEELFLSEASIKYYNGRLFKKTAVKNKMQLVRLFNEG